MSTRGVPSEAELIADLVALGARLEAESRVLDDPTFDDWYVAKGWRWLAFLSARRIPLMGVYLVRRAARIRPDWVDPQMVVLEEPLAVQLLELDRTIRESSQREEL